jgi:hypothetical protein
MENAVEMASCGIIYIHVDWRRCSKVIKLAFSNLRVYNVGDTDGRDLRITPLRWDNMSRYASTCQVSCRLV